jgi:hypothetical protein
MSLTREQVEDIRSDAESSTDDKFWEAWRDDVIALCDTALAAMDERDHLRRIVDETPTMMAMEQAELVPGLQRENRELREALRAVPVHTLEYEADRMDSMAHSIERRGEPAENVAKYRAEAKAWRRLAQIAERDDE